MRARDRALEALYKTQRDVGVRRAPSTSRSGYVQVLLLHRSMPALQHVSTYSKMRRHVRTLPPVLVLEVLVLELEPELFDSILRQAGLCGC